MHYLIGTDEAGYGPNLGPLVISATVWQVPDDVRCEDLYDRLSAVIVPAKLPHGSERRKKGLAPSAEQTSGTQETPAARCLSPFSATPQHVSQEASAPVPMADSKILYTPGGGLRHLERGLWAALALLESYPRTWREMWRTLAPDCMADLHSAPWHAAYDPPLPLDADPAELLSRGATLHEGLAGARVRLVALRSRAVFPAEFNALVQRYDSKGTALSHLTLGLVTQVMEPLGDGPISIVCDKHGARNSYAPLLFEHFPGGLIEIHGEGRQQSTYRFGPPGRRIEFSFRTKAESCLPVALASMASKYLRELAMRAFNDFWCSRVADLQPTAGYPQDARRFKQAIAPVQAQLQIDEQTLWRMR